MLLAEKRYVGYNIMGCWHKIQSLPIINFYFCGSLSLIRLIAYVNFFTNYLFCVSVSYPLETSSLDDRCTDAIFVNLATLGAYNNISEKDPSTSFNRPAIIFLLTIFLSDGLMSRHSWF